MAYLEGVTIDRPIGKSPTVASSSYPREIHAPFYGFDTARFPNSPLEDLLFGIEGVYIKTSAVGDNSSVTQHGHSINSVTNGRISSSFPESRWEELLLNKWLSMDHIPWAISIAGGLTKSTTQTKLVALLATNKFRNVSEKRMGVLRKCYPSDKKYIAIPGTIPGEQELDARAAARRSGSLGNSRKVSELPINCTVRDRNIENP